MIKRRTFLELGAAATLASGLTPAWAACASPRFLATAIRPNGEALLLGLDAQGAIAFEAPLPARGHAAAAHPSRAEAVVFARRPGRFALIINCASGQEIAMLNAPEGRHYYGHGAFTADGRYLLTTENAYDAPDGRIGVWDAENGYARLDEFASGGLGPHEIIRLPSGGFAVANGGVQTHPDFRRAKLNLPNMRPNLTYLSAQGVIEEQASPPEKMRFNSIRHIDADANGRVAIALQWEGAPQTIAPLTATHMRGEELEYLEHPDTPRLRHYGGSVAISQDGATIATTGPRGDHVLFFDARTGAAQGSAELPIASGVARTADGLAITSQGGVVFWSGGRLKRQPVERDFQWDNHLVAL